MQNISCSRLFVGATETLKA